MICIGSRVCEEVVRSKECLAASHPFYEEYMVILMFGVSTFWCRRPVLRAARAFPSPITMSTTFVQHGKNAAELWFGRQA